MYKNCSTNEGSSAPQYDRCESKVIGPTTLGECDSKCYPPYGRPGPVVVKVPVVLANCKVQIDVESEIRLDEPAFDIKTIDKDVCITQCHLVPHTNKLFLAGYVQKNVQYSTVECANETSISGDILHSTFRIPFKCVTAVCFDKWPILGESFKERSKVLDEGMLCADDTEDSWVHYNKFYEPTFCELEWSRILETDIYDRNRNCGAKSFAKERCFQKFTEKMVIYIGIKILQNQQVCIPEPTCRVEMKEECDEDRYEEHVEVCYVPEKGMMGRATKYEKY